MATKKVTYQGRSDIRVLDASDLAQAGVEGFRKTEFPRRQPVEVETKVADALIENPKLFGKFGIHEDIVETESAASATDDSAKAAGSSTRTK